MRTKKSVSAAERKRDYHAGPGESYPLDPAGNRLRAAWDLAGHAANPDEVRRKIINFAREHGLMDKLPQAALDWHKGQSGNVARKARNDDLRDVIRYAFHQIPDYEPDEQRRFIEAVQARGNAHLLPDEAHGYMHMHNMPHTHEGEDNEMHSHMVQKAFNPVAKSFVIEKSWTSEDEKVTYIEGWLSTEDRDLEKDIVRPESFQPSIKGYFERRAPLSYEHKTDRLPAGHLQRAALVRDGKVFAEEVHPTDPADFEHFPGRGTGVYVRGAITDELVGSAVRKGNMGSFSYIANVTKFRYLPGGGREFIEQDPWLESTVAAYPVNQKAVITVAKAYGLTDTKENMDWEQKLEELLAGAAAVNPEPEPQPVAKGVTADEIKALLAEFKTSIENDINQRVESQVSERVEKALTTMRGESQGRRAPMNGSDTPDIEENPLDYIVHKARSVKSEDELTDQDKQLAWGVTRAALMVGMKDSELE
jgi:hypothetical protein